VRSPLFTGSGNRTVMCLQTTTRYLQSHQRRVAPSNTPLQSVQGLSSWKRNHRGFGRQGPLTGAEILDALGDDALFLWRACRRSKQVAIQTIGCRYLRLDSKIEGFARLSPSILREFLTYSAIGLTRDQDSLVRKANEIASHIKEVSKAKLELAKNVFSTVLSRLEMTFS